MREEQDFKDSENWLRLSKKYKIRLPLWRMACTTGGMRRYLKKLNIPVEEYLKANNERILKDFGKNNPEWPLRAWAGLILEDMEFKETHEQ